MGGLGSGNHTGRGTCEGLHSIDVNRLNREGMLKEWFGGWGWRNSDGESTGSVTLSIAEGKITASGTLEGEPWKQSWWLDWTDCNFGGIRPWFRCPYCSRRVGKLYIGNDGFACRHCYRLVNVSTRLDTMDRLWRKIDRLGARLHDEGDEYVKPKGMHWKTFERICDEINVLEQRKDIAFIEGAMRILKIDSLEEIEGW